jgi:hypothetical protein
MKRPASRTVEPELLDELPPTDPRALRSRRDLRLLNLGMGHPPLMARALLEHLRGRNAPRIVELGAGDGHFLLSVANRLRPQWPSAEATLVDRLDSFDPRIQARFSSLGWRMRTEIKTASEWLRQSSPGSADAIVFNLFLHQFKDDDLTEMLGLAARTTNLLIAVEPRRSRVSRLGGSILWLIGCGPVTRHDADVSIRAGFYGEELSTIWPNKKDWSLIERPAGLFSHLFIAQRTDQ